MIEFKFSDVNCTSNFCLDLKIISLESLLGQDQPKTLSVLSWRLQSNTALALCWTQHWAETLLSQIDFCLQRFWLVSTHACMSAFGYVRACANTHTPSWHNHYRLEFMGKKNSFNSQQLIFCQYLPLVFPVLPNLKLPETENSLFLLSVYDKFAQNVATIKQKWKIHDVSCQNRASDPHLKKPGKHSSVQYYPLWEQQLESWLHCSQWESCY